MAYVASDAPTSSAGPMIGRSARRPGPVARISRRQPNPMRPRPTASADQSSSRSSSARDSGIGMDEERVLAAVAPAIQVEQRIAKERAGQGQTAQDHVCGDDRQPRRRERTRPSGAASTRWKTNTSVSGVSTAPRLRRSGFGALRALPVGPEPREAGQQREHAKAPRSRLDRGEPAGDDEPEASRDVGHPSSRERGGIGRREVGAAIDAEDRGDRPREGKR